MIKEYFDKQTSAIILCLTALSFAFCIIGAGKGLPSSEKANLVFKDKSTLTQLADTIKKAREEVYTSYDKQVNYRIRKTYDPPEGSQTVDLNGLKQEIDIVKIHALRSVLLQSKWPDEQHFIAALSAIKPSKLDFDPRIYQYGGFYIYPVGLSIKLAEMLGYIKLSGGMETLLTNPDEVRKIYFVPKLLGAFVASLGVIAIFLCGSALFGRSTGILSAVFYAVLPSIPVESHCLKPFAYFMPFALMSLFYSANILKEKDTFSYLSAGIFAGLSAGSLVLSGTIFFSGLTAHFFNERKFNRKLMIYIVAFILVFIITNPYYIISFKSVLREFTTNTEGVGINFSLSNITYHLSNLFHIEFGSALYTFVLSGILLSFFKRTLSDYLILAAFIPFYAFLMISMWYKPHYDMPAVPLVLVLSARLSVYFGERMKWHSLYKLFLASVVIYTLGNTIYYDSLIIKSDKYFIDTGEWINKNIPSSASIRFMDYPYFGFYGYPYFSLLSYSINKEEKSDYLILRNDKNKGSSIPGYRLINTFGINKGFLDITYKNYLLPYLETPVDIYAREDIK